MFVATGFALLTSVVLAQTPPATPPAKPTATPPATPPATAPAPTPAAATSDYYPLKAGNKWTYRIDDQRSLEMKVDKFENGEATILTVSSNRTVAKDTIKVLADGIVRTKINDTAIAPPLKILALPVTKGASWEIKSKVGDKEIVGKLTVVNDKEKLKLTNGKEYECVFVEGSDLKVDGTATKMKVWFTAGKGIVKLNYETSGQEASLELIEFTEGK